MTAPANKCLLVRSSNLTTLLGFSAFAGMHQFQHKPLLGKAQLLET